MIHGNGILHITISFAIIENTAKFINQRQATACPLKSRSMCHRFLLVRGAPGTAFSMQKDTASAAVELSLFMTA
jgi:hypothetical protein